MKTLQLVRPLCVIDVESTGTSPTTDRIIDLAMLRLEPGGLVTRWETLVNPAAPIPASATAIHGITDNDVRSAPLFGQIAPRVIELLDGADILGFNLVRFDLPMLSA